MPELLSTRDHVLNFLNEHDGVTDGGPCPPDVWQAITRHDLYDPRATRTLRPRVAEVEIERDENEGDDDAQTRLVYEGDKDAPDGLYYEWQEPDHTWGEFITVMGDHLRRDDDTGTWALVQRA